MMKKSKNNFIKKKSLILTLALLCLTTLSFAQYSVTYLVVGGGGSGGPAAESAPGSGGGGGGAVFTGNTTIGIGTYAICVGAGGTGGSAAGNIGTNGGSSSFNGVTAGGGGYGGDYYGNTAANGSNGSSGGGSGGTGVNTAAYGTGSSPGYSGGSCSSNFTLAGGGGGASAVGSNGTSSGAGAGGAGALNSITGSALHYGGGGGGGTNSSGSYGSAGAGGAGGGGNGGDAGNSYNGYSGTANTGGGGGGATSQPGGGNGYAGAGGSGVVILSFSNNISYAQSGGVVTANGSNTVITFTAGCSNTFSIISPPIIPWIWGGNTGTCSGGVSQIFGALDACADLPIYAGGVECMFIESHTGTNPGFVGINTNTPAYQLDVNGDIRCITLHQTSDKRFKKDIKKLESVNDKLKKLSGYTYSFNTEDFKDRNFNKEQQIGLIAQELKEVYPQLVSEDKKGYYSVNYIGMIPVLLEAVKDLQKQVDELKANGNANASSVPSANRLAVSLTDIDVLVLNQNVPNPFAEQTTITYSIPQSAGLAQLLFYDANGRQIKTIDITTKGSGQLNVYANDLTNGIYSYTLVVDGKIIDTKKMVKQQ